MSRIITLGEVLMRLTLSGGQRFKEAEELEIAIGGAEANVAVSLANYGHEVSLISALPDNELGKRVCSYLDRHSISRKFVYPSPGRMGLYFVEEGFGVRPSIVEYDRNFSAFTQLDPSRIEWEGIFKNADVLHLSGITPALGDESKKLTMTALEEARKRNLTISFDCNYRSKLWSLREAKETFEQIFPYVDICFIGYKDFVHILGQDGEASFSEEKLQEFYEDFAETYEITVLACTNRRVLYAHEHVMQGFIYQNNHFHQTPSVQFNVLDRIGGGDSFAAGILHSFLQEQRSEDIVTFGLSAGILKHTVKGDHNQFSEDEVINWMAREEIDVTR